MPDDFMPAVIVLCLLALTALLAWLLSRDTRR